MKYRAYIQAVERKGKKGSRVTLYQRLYYGGRQWQSALGISVPSTDYDKKTETVSGEDAGRYNSVLAKSKQIIKDAMLRFELIEHKVPSLDEVVAEWEKGMTAAGLRASDKYSNKDTDSQLLQDRITEFIQDQTATKGWEDSTGGRFDVIKGHIERYGKPLRFDSLTDDDLLAFLAHLAQEGKANTTIQRMSGQLRWYLRWCAKKGYYSGNCHETFRPKFKGGDFSDKNIIYLTVDELRKLEAYSFPPNKAYLERVRDAFLFSCFSGLRYSDVAALRPENIGDVATALLTRKDRSRLRIELNRHTRAILDKYKEEARVTGRAIPLPSNQKANKYLHELCKLCGIDTPTSQVYNRNGKREEVWLPKYELITFHAGRKTFITQALRMGVPVPVIMEFSGHKTIKNLSRYLNIVDELKQKEMSKFDDI